MRRTAAVVLLAVAVFSAGAGVIAARPFRVFGLDELSLGYSVARNTGGVSGLGDDHDRCRRTTGREWRCSVSSNGSDGLVYEIRTDSRGCWTGRRVGPPGGIDRAPKRASGCLAILDYVRFWSR